MRQSVYDLSATRDNSEPVGIGSERMRASAVLKGAPMTSHDAERANRVKQFFHRYFRPAEDLRDQNAIRLLLPTDRSDLLVLRAHCMNAAPEAMHAGRHMEMRRFDLLARQLARLAA